MIKAIREFLALPSRFKKLQAEHDLRAVLNGRLQRHCELQRREIKKLSGSKSQRALRLAEASAVAQEETKALRHVRHMRSEVERRMLAVLLPLHVVIDIQEKARAMTDEEVMAFKLPKRETCDVH